MRALLVGQAVQVHVKAVVENVKATAKMNAQEAAVLDAVEHVVTIVIGCVTEAVKMAVGGKQIVHVKSYLHHVGS